MWIFRPLSPDEAPEACTVIRQSITVLCWEDHDGNPAILEPWLANKTAETVLGWIESNPTGVIGAVEKGQLGGVGGILPGGRIVLNYVAPWARFRGVSQGLMGTLEGLAAAQGERLCTLTSTMTARQFYLKRGYTGSGPPVSSFGGKLAFPMGRLITPPPPGTENLAK
jgi:GNAT superfamily N-acetyltransferase